MKKIPERKLPEVILASPEMLARMQRLFARPTVSFAVAKAQTDRVLKGRSDANESKPASQNGRLRKAG